MRNITSIKKDRDILQKNQTEIIEKEDQSTQKTHSQALKTKFIIFKVTFSTKKRQEDTMYRIF